MNAPVWHPEWPGFDHGRGRAALTGLVTGSEGGGSAMIRAVGMGHSSGRLSRDPSERQGGRVALPIGRPDRFGLIESGKWGLSGWSIDAATGRMAASIGERTGIAVAIVAERARAA